MFRLSGRLNRENVGELESLLKSQMEQPGIRLDVEDLTLVDREAIRSSPLLKPAVPFSRTVPPCIREWIRRDADRSYRV